MKALAVMTMMAALTSLAGLAVEAGAQDASPGDCFEVSTTDLSDEAVQVFYDEGFWVSFSGDPTALPDAIMSPACVMDEATLELTPGLTVLEFNALSDTNRALLSSFQDPPDGYQYAEDFSMVPV